MGTDEISVLQYSGWLELNLFYNITCYATASRARRLRGPRALLLRMTRAGCEKVFARSAHFCWDIRALVGRYPDGLWPLSERALWRGAVTHVRHIRTRALTKHERVGPARNAASRAGEVARFLSRRGMRGGRLFSAFLSGGYRLSSRGAGRFLSVSGAGIVRHFDVRIGGELQAARDVFCRQAARVLCALVAQSSRASASGMMRNSVASGCVGVDGA